MEVLYLFLVNFFNLLQLVLPFDVQFADMQEGAEQPVCEIFALMFFFLRFFLVQDVFL